MTQIKPHHRRTKTSFGGVVAIFSCVAAALCIGGAAEAADWATNLYPTSYIGNPIVQPRVEKKVGAKNGEAKNGEEKNGDKAFEVDSEHIFGFTQGSDIGEKGELEFETEPTAAIGKRFGTYLQTAHETSFKYSVTDDFRVSPGFLFVTHDIRNVPGFDDQKESDLAGAGAEIRYRIFNREKAPFGLTFTFEPAWSRIDELTGEHVQQYGSALGLLLDKEIIHNRLYGAINFFYELSATHLKTTGEWTDDLAVQTDVALSYQFLPGWLLGVEAQYAQQYEGLGLNRLKGEALYVGPTFFTRLGDRANISAAWDIQVAGKAVDEPGKLDLINFERHRFRNRLAILLNSK